MRYLVFILSILMFFGVALPSRSVQAAQASTVPQHIVDLLGMHVYDYAVEDYVRAKSQNVIWALDSTGQEITVIPLSDRIFYLQEGNVFYTVDQGLESYSFDATSFGVEKMRLPYHLKTQMTRQQVEQRVGKPAKVGSYTINDWRDEGTKKEIISTHYPDRGMSISYWSRSGKIYSIRVKAEVVPIFTSYFNREIDCDAQQPFLQEINKAKELSAEFLLAGKYNDSEKQASQAINGFMDVKKACSQAEHTLPNREKKFLGNICFNRGVARMMLGRYEDANHDMRIATFVGNRDVEIFYWLGISEIFTGRLERANQRVVDLEATGKKELADKLRSNINLYKQGKQIQL